MTGLGADLYAALVGSLALLWIVPVVGILTFVCAKVCLIWHARIQHADHAGRRRGLWI